jgi:Rieske Fe-S protein
MTSEGWSMTTGHQDNSRLTRRGVLLGVGLAGLGGALAGCSTAAVPYGANEAGVAEPGAGGTPSAAGGMTSGGMTSGGTGSGGTASGGTGSGGMASSAPPSAPAQTTPPASEPAKASAPAKVNGTVLGDASEIPVGGGKIYTAAKVVVTQPTRGQYKGFSAVCTHVGCIMSQVANGTIDCPCHGSEFKITNGAVVTGPAPSPLPAKPVTVTDGKVVLM